MLIAIKHAQKYQTVGPVPKSIPKSVEKRKIDTLNKQIHDHSLSWFVTSN